MKYEQTKCRQVCAYLLVTLCLLAGVARPAAAVTDGKKTVKILAIGNSFSQDAVEQYLHQLAAAEGFLTVIGNMFIGGCSLERHVRNARADAPAYAYRKIDVTGKKTETAGMTLEKALADEDWDYVSLQQASPFSGLYPTYEASLPELAAYVEARVSAKTKLMLHQTWAYAADATHTGFKNYNADQLAMYHAIVQAVRKAARLTKIKIIIPSGTAIQNARTSFVGDRMNRDGYHLDVKIGRYTAACTWFERIFRRSVLGNPYAPEGLDEARRNVAQRAAHEAVAHPYRITDLSRTGAHTCIALPSFPE